MRVNPNDGVCRSCRGELIITDCDDATMSVECMSCGDNYLVEPDAFKDGAIHYHPAVLAQKMESSGHD